MDPADQDAVHRMLEAQGRLLGQHDQLLTDIWTSLQTLNASVTNLLSSGRSEQGPRGAESHPAGVRLYGPQPFWRIVNQIAVGFESTICWWCTINKCGQNHHPLQCAATGQLHQE
ncbi:hypothetical protein D4764_15G0009830 [Takifugu flavidus]|uniref:Uncharacterized protein n=1 Tax=Takifugu flavidus TaxID=433684 RepID=A0A5C6P3T6_9TELE|nr:hypothetical protein D4764_15G0009830 [Takifugu flavidus]